MCAGVSNPDDPRYSCDCHLHDFEHEEYEQDGPRPDEMTGFCIACNEPAYGVMPDAKNYPCESCGERTVYGARWLRRMGYAGGV